MMASSLAWLADYAEHLLRQPEADYSPSPTDPPNDSQPRPLAVLLLWLDCLSFLANSTPQPTPIAEDPSPADQAEASGSESDRPASRLDRAQGSPPSPSDSIDEFTAYLGQVVSRLPQACFLLATFSSLPAGARAAGLGAWEMRSACLCFVLRPGIECGVREFEAQARAPQPTRNATPAEGPHRGQGPSPCQSPTC